MIQRASVTLDKPWLSTGAIDATGRLGTEVHGKNGRCVASVLETLHQAVTQTPKAVSRNLYGCCSYQILFGRRDSVPYLQMLDVYPMAYPVG